MKRITMAVLALVFMVASCVTSYAGAWEAVGADWKYKNDNGAYSANCWQWIDGKCYCFKADGIMYKDCTTPDGYKVNKDGAWVNDKDVVQVQQAATNTAAASSADQRLVYFNEKYGFNANSPAYLKEWNKTFVNTRTCSELKSFLTGIDWPNMTEMQRVEACFNRIALGKNGNRYGYGTSNDNEKKILVHKEGICQDYAEEMRDLCKLVGIEAYVDSRPFHAITKVKVNGSWYAVDSCYGTGELFNNVCYAYNDPKLNEIYGASENTY